MYYHRLINNLLFVIAITLLLFACQSKTSNEKSFNSETVEYHNISDSLKTVQLKIAYVGNMGICIEHMDKTVIIDGLHQFYKKEYVHPTQEMVNNLINGTFKSFTEIEFCLVTHLHGDHFSGANERQFLEKNPQGFVLGSSQLTDNIITDSIADRFYKIPYDNQPYFFKEHDISVTAIRCDHANSVRHASTENLAFLVDISNYKILHVGDTDWRETEKPFNTLSFKDKSIDIAILPYWMLLDNDAYQKINNRIAPKHIIATHIPPNMSQRYIRQLKSTFSNIRLFTKLGEIFYYSK
ncbi:MBL fold metallo-hydrolase [Psychroserpens sp. MEBiC05023]